MTAFRHKVEVSSRLLYPGAFDNLCILPTSGCLPWVSYYHVWWTSSSLQVCALRCAEIVRIPSESHHIRRPGCEAHTPGQHEPCNQHHCLVYIGEQCAHEVREAQFVHDCIFMYCLLCIVSPSLSR